VSNVDDLCAEAQRLLGDADDSVLSRLIEAQVLATLAVVEELGLIREELGKGRKT
jgi:hypothetical protein